MKRDLKFVKTIVIKVGSSTLTQDNGMLDIEHINHIVNQITKLKEKYKVIFVTSGAIAAGIGEMKLSKRPRIISELQALAAIGQNVLMNFYHSEFAKYNIKIAQMLLAEEDFAEREKYLNMRNTLNTLLSMDVVPIINENDPVATAELKIGDNDRLSAMVAANLGADLLLILSNIDGLYDKDPSRCKNYSIIKMVEEITPELEKVVGGATGFGVGGMKTKLMAAKICQNAGLHMLIVNGRKKNIMLKIMDGENQGTIFVPKEKKSQKEMWIAFSPIKGTIEIDDGAMKALLSRKSLLPSGIKGVKGRFGVGDVVNLVCKIPIAKGIVDYSSMEIEKIKGCRSDKIVSILGYSPYDAVVRSDNLVLV